MNQASSEAMSRSGNVSIRAGRAPRRRHPARGIAWTLGLTLWLAAGLAAAEDTVIGVAEPDPELDDGTVAVRVIGEEASHPIAGERVTLVGPGGAVLTARTGASGWAQFPGVAAGAQYVARVEIDDTSLDSDPITVPPEGGVRITLSAEHDNRPPQHQPAGARAMAQDGGGPSGMPDPRQMSGVPRGEQGDPAGQLTVRAVQGDFSPTESDAPEGAVIHLIGYGADGSVTRDSRPVDDEGRVRFENLVIDGSRTYYAVGLFDRGDVEDRFLSHPISMPPTVGVRVMLAGPAVDSDEPPVDDVSEHAGQSSQSGPPVPPGDVVVRLFGQVADVSEVELVELDELERPQVSPIGTPSPIPSDVQGELGGPQADDGLRDGLVTVAVQGHGEPLGGARVRVVAVDEPEEARELRTTSSGEARFDDLAPGRRYTLSVDVFGREFTSQPFEAPQQGGLSFRLRSSWQMDGMLEARFRNVPADPSKVYAAQVKTDDGVFRSMPFQLTPERGAAVGLVVFNEVLLRFHLIGEIDDARIWYDAQFELRNITTAPMMPEGERLSIPLPRGFVAANVHENHQHQVRTGSDGYIWRGAVGPGREAFRGQFALPIRSGGFEFDMALPYGAWDSQLIVQRWPGMTLRLPDVAGMREETRPFGGHEFTLLSDINIEHGRRLVIGADGLPQRSALERYLRVFAGVVGLGLLGWGFFGLFRRRGEVAVDDRKTVLDRERERLLDELAALERQYQQGSIAEARYRRSRDNLRIELENVYTELRAGREQKAS